MQVSDIVHAIDRELERLQQARDLLSGTKRRGRRPSSAATTTSPRNGRRTLSAEARRVVSEKLKARWAERKKLAARKK